MKRLIGTVAALAAPLLVMGAASPAEAKHCKCKPGHHAKAPAKHHAPGRAHHTPKPHHVKPAHPAHGDGMNTYGWQRHSGYGHAAPGYGAGHGPGYGYVGEPNREGSYARSYSSYDVKTYEYDSGWQSTPPGAPLPAPYGQGAHGYSQSYDSGWTRPSQAAPCPHPGAVMCLPPGPPAGGQPGAPYALGHHGQGVALQPGFEYGLDGGVGGRPAMAATAPGGGRVFVGSTTGGSAFSGARAAAFASASAKSRVRAYGGRHGYKRGH
jgi:hypothetical protein